MPLLVPTSVPLLGVQELQSWSGSAAAPITVLLLGALGPLVGRGVGRDGESIQPQQPKKRRRNLGRILAADGIDPGAVQGRGKGCPVPDPQDDVSVGTVPGIQA